MTDRVSKPRPHSREDVVFRALVDEWVLFDPMTHNLHVLNHTAALIWNLCDGESDEAGLVVALQDLMEDAPDAETLGAHVRETVATFEREGLLR